MLCCCCVFQADGDYDMDNTAFMWREFELALENVRRCTVQEVGKIRQQLMAGLSELQKFEEDVFNSLNKVGDRLRRVQGRGVSGERVGDVVSVQGERNRGDVNSGAVRSVSAGGGECTSVAAGGGEGGTVRTTVSDNSYAGVAGRAPCQTSVRGSAGVRRPQSSVLEQPAKRMKFHRRSGTVGFISDSQFKVMVEDDEMQAVIFQRNYEKHLLFHRGAKSSKVVSKSKVELEKWAKEGVDKVIACFGSVDILNMEYESQDWKCVVEEISRAVCELKKICDGLQMKLIYVTPVLPV